MGRITKLDIKQLNDQFKVVDELKAQIAKLQEAHNSTQQRVDTLEIHAAPTSNDLTFTWTGSTHTLSWSDGSVQDKNGANVPVKAGSKVLLASTYYWMAWNRVHRQMIAETDVQLPFQNRNNIVICQVFTGTAGQTGTAGGGGSNSAKELSGAKYKNF